MSFSLKEAQDILIVLKGTYEKMTNSSLDIQKQMDKLQKTINSNVIEDMDSSDVDELFKKEIRETCVRYDRGVLISNKNMTSSRKKYNHAFSIAFSLESNKEGGDITNAELRVALFKRIYQLENEGTDLIECCGLPFDTYEN